jgi:AcrR family transcriptional regulator
MSPRTAKQFKEIRVEKRKIILDTAMELFANEGYHATSISKIAKTANISKGLMYNYFTSKEALLKAILVEATEKVWDHFDPNHDGVLTFDEFIYYIQKSIQTVKENTNYWKLYSTLMMQSNVFEIINDDFKPITDNYSKLLLAFFKSCGLTDPEGELLLFSSAIKGAIIQFLGAPNYYPLDQFEKKIIDFYSGRLIK